MLLILIYFLKLVAGLMGTYVIIDVLIRIEDAVTTLR